MTRSKARAARVAGSVVMLAAVIPALTAGAALAADAPVEPATVVTEAASTSYADEVAIGTALRIAAPGVAEEDAAAATPVKAVKVAKAADPTTSPSTAASSSTEPSADPESTVVPSDAEVIETDSRQNAEDPDEVAVLGNRIGSNELASTGPSQVTTQALLALALIGLGLALRVGPGLVAAAGNRRH